MKKENPIVDAAGNKYWYLNGEFHREDGPAIEYINGDKFWYIKGKLHREDGPAVEWLNGYKVWYLNNKIIAKQRKGEKKPTIYNQKIWDKMKSFCKKGRGKK